MKEQFVPYELAIKLKEKGFDESCFGLYNIYETYGQHGIINISDLLLINVNKGFKGENAIIAPLYQQVIDWFRKKYNIIIEVQFLGGLTKETAQYIFTVWVGEEYGIENDDSTQDWSNNYEEVRQKAIEHALTLI